jgi:hypothetical protein
MPIVGSFAGASARAYGAGAGGFAPEGALKLIETKTLTAASSAQFDNVFSNSYYQYKIVPSLLGSTTNQGLQMQFVTGGTRYTTASYQRQQVYSYGSVFAAARYTGETSWAFGPLNSGFINHNFFELSYPFQTKYTTGVSLYNTNSNSGSIESGSYVHAVTVTNSFDGVYFAPASGTMTGTISIYGYKLSI